MARHETHKDTEEGKEFTLSARARRAMKYHVPPFDARQLERELHQQQTDNRLSREEES